MDDLGNRTGNQTLRQHGTVHFAPAPIALEITLYYYNDQWQVVSTYDRPDALGVCTRGFIFGNYIDEVLLMNDGTDDYFYLHDHLYSPVALLDDTGAIVERCEYDAYGSVQILTSNFSPLTSSQHGNPYAFTGRELDILDGGALHHMHFRHRDYSPPLGRFLQQDPHGINPAGGEVNAFHYENQYKDGINLLQYVKTNPLIRVDMYGLWGADIHYHMTALRAVFKTNMWPWYAKMVGFHNNNIDSIHFPGTISHQELSWHFDTDGHTEDRPTWGATDSRYVHAERELKAAIAECREKSSDLDATIAKALEHLGHALHPVQDFVAHGTWKPWPTLWHPNPVHPNGTDTWLLDFKYTSDGILVDWDALGGPPTPWPWDWFNTEKAWFKPGTKRKLLTENMTDAYLERFKSGVINTPCFCKIYFIGL